MGWPGGEGLCHLEGAVKEDRDRELAFERGELARRGRDLYTEWAGRARIRNGRVA